MMAVAGGDSLSESEQNTTCSVCYQLLLEPTTLNCGHTVCRGCLAGWYLSSRKCTCPLCRQEWEGYPKVNTTMRSLVELIFADKLRERKMEMEGNPEHNYRMNLDQFERELQKKTHTRTLGQNHAQRNYAFFAGIVVTVLGVLLFDTRIGNRLFFGLAHSLPSISIPVAYLLMSWSWGPGKGKERAEMPVATWQAEDVAQWLNSLGWARHYSPFAHQYQVDGRALLNLEAEKLMELLNVTDPYHKNAFDLAVVYLRESGVRMPQTVWEYKALYPERAVHLSLWMKDAPLTPVVLMHLFFYDALYPERAVHLSLWMKDAPRTTAVLLYLFFYEDTFLPFLHATVPRHWEEELRLNQQALPSPTVAQWLMFTFMMLVFPYGMMGLFAWSLRSAHTLTHLIVIFPCFVQTFFELSFLSGCLLHRGLREWKQYLWSHVQRVLFLSLTFCFCRIFVPYWILSILFYYTVYFTPVKLCKSVHQIVTGAQN
ncbi:hypothetical protein ACOMHN_037689 [Nucella lapillus]